jgi:hypothetical protein
VIACFCHLYAFLLRVQDLNARLQTELGMRFERTKWTDAWTVELSSALSDTNSALIPLLKSSRKAAAQALKVALPAVYILVCAQDWTTTLTSVVTDLELNKPESVSSAFVVLGLYVLRHVYMYYGLAKWCVQWDRGLFN